MERDGVMRPEPKGVQLQPVARCGGGERAGLLTAAEDPGHLVATQAPGGRDSCAGDGRPCAPRAQRTPAVDVCKGLAFSACGQAAV